MVRISGVVVPVQKGKQRALLAALLLNAGRAVSLDELAEALWGPDPPPSARVTIQNYVMRLRKALGDTGTSRIGTLPSGYAIQADASELDVARFEDLLSAARAAALRDERGRLDALDTGEPASSARTVFSWSYRNLSQPAARMFRLLGLHPGPDITVAAAASLAGITPGQARRCLEELTVTHLRHSCRTAGPSRILR
jgi:DNA-binding winged helix-turn-helix (wHTH) protein